MLYPKRLIHFCLIELQTYVQLSTFFFLTTVDQEILLYSYTALDDPSPIFLVKCFGKIPDLYLTHNLLKNHVCKNIILMSSSL